VLYDKLRNFLMKEVKKERKILLKRLRNLKS